MKQQNQLNKLKQKFNFLGKFMAKAVMDSRVLDLPLSTTFYKLLIDRTSVSEDDLKNVDSQLYSSISSLRDYVRQRRQILFEMSQIGSNSSVDLDKKLSELEEVRNFCQLFL